MKNQAWNPEYRKIMDKLRKQMEKELKKNGDPRMNGNGDIFDKYQYMGKAMDYNKKKLRYLFKIN